MDKSSLTVVEISVVADACSRAPEACCVAAAWSSEEEACTWEMAVWSALRTRPPTRTDTPTHSTSTVKLPQRKKFTKRWV